MKVIKEPSNVKECEVDFRIIRQDHETIWIHEKIRYEYDTYGKQIRRYGVVLDITQRKLIELKLKESEAKFKQLFEHMTNGFSLHEVVMDEQGNPIDFSFLMINKAYEVQMNVRSEDILGKTMLEINPAAAL